MTNDEIIDRIYQISGFLVGFGDAAALAASKLRELASEIENADKIARLDESTPDWRNLKHENGNAQFSADGTMLDDQGNRSIFDDVDE